MQKFNLRYDVGNIPNTDTCNNLLAAQVAADALAIQSGLHTACSERLAVGIYPPNISLTLNATIGVDVNRVGGKVTFTIDIHSYLT